MRTHLPILAAAGVMLAAAGASAQPVQLSAMAQLGKDMFFDRSLSGSGAMSCATCHDPAHHFAPANDQAVQIGGPYLSEPGIRATPSLTYRSFTPTFSVGPADEASEAGDATPMAAANGAVSGGPAGPLGAAPPATGKSGTDNAANMVPRGGMFWDGRVDTLQDQALGPLMSPFEMANPDIATLAEKVRKGYGDRIAQLAGRNVLDDPQALVGEAGFAIARYQIEDRSSTRSTAATTTISPARRRSASRKCAASRSMRIATGAIAPTAIRTSRQRRHAAALHRLPV